MDEQVRSDLIYDVGVNNGDDTAYYLAKGYRVVGIEADPSLIPELKQRFAKEVASGRLELVNVALAPERKVAQFWICEGHRLWNSFDREVATRLGRKAHPVDVECWPLRDFFAKYGVPYYLKMSLHGEEHFCLQDIRPDIGPSYISLELPRQHELADQVFTRLAKLNYGQCKIIDQTTQKQLVVTPPSLKTKIKGKIKALPGVGFVLSNLKSKASSASGGQVRTSGVLGSDGWLFPEGSSGPFGEETDGAWKATEDARADWAAFVGGATGHHVSELTIWHDVHAKRTFS